MATRYPAVLVNHGSFNPVHKDHLQMMVQARQCLEAAGFEVVRGIMAITPTERLVRKGAEAMTDTHRLAALQIGCESTPETCGWLVPEPRGVNFGSGSQCVHGLSAEIYAAEPHATIFKVIGADTAVRYKGELKGGPTVVVCREGSTEELHQAIKHSAQGRKDIFVVDELPGVECSSTKVRDALRSQDDLTIGTLCGKRVAEYLLAHSEQLYHGGTSSPRAKAAAGYGKLASSCSPCQLAEMLPVGLTASAAVGPTPGPGDGTDAATLKSIWATTFPSTDVIDFYGHGTKAGHYRSFSNFFDQSDMPFDFEIPTMFCACVPEEKDRVVRCDFSEKAIMLCKALAMADLHSFNEVRQSSDPAAAKKVGRNVSNFDNALWDRIVCSVAFEVVYQKFSKTPAIRSVLLDTGDRMLAEATRNDQNWGIGIDVGDPRVQRPSKWRGANILGWALMEARTALRNESGTNRCSASTGSGPLEGAEASAKPQKARRWGR